MQNIIKKIYYNKKQILKGIVIIVSLPLVMVLFNILVFIIFKFGIFIGTFLRDIFNYAVC